MNSSAQSAFDEVRAFWFGELDSNGQSDSAHAAAWWKKDEQFDSEIRDRFSGLHSSLIKGDHISELDRPKDRLAAIITLDQFSRNMFRGSPQMFAADSLALGLTQRGLAQQMDNSLALDERAFFYMPLMHHEELASQDTVVELLEDLLESAPAAAKSRLRANVSAAHKHREIVAKWGRFPHRNATLGRESTQAETEFLTQPGSSF